jgi:GTP cyclohydrolase I
MMATYVGRTKAQTRNVIVIAEAVRGCMVVEAIGRKGVNVRLTVSRDSLREPQPDLFG